MNIPAAHHATVFSSAVLPSAVFAPLGRLLATAALLLALFAGLGCGGDTDTAPPNSPADTSPPPDAAPATDTLAPPDTAPAVDAGPPVDAGPTPQTFEPQPFQVGVSRNRVPCPVGMGVAGFGQINLSGGDVPKSRFAENYPASKGHWTHPTIHTVAVVGQPDTVVFMRIDAIGMKEELREAVVARILEKGGPDLEQTLVVAATHTHSAPGRLFDNDLWAAVLDSFFPEYYLRIVDVMAQSAMDAIADAEPARFGWGLANTDALHSDRRCESPDNKDGRMPILRFDRADGTLKALIMMYSVHGTVVGTERRLLTRDFHGGVELKIEENIDHPITALFFNSWSGDAGPKWTAPQDSHGIQPEFGGIEAAGNLAADVVTKALPDITTTDTLVVRSQLTRVPLNRDVLGYEGGTFPYEYGAVYCASGLKAACYDEVEAGAPLPKASVMTTSCIPFAEAFPAPMETIVGAFQLGDLFVATMPGEPVTPLGTSAIAQIRQATGQDHVFLLGYAQDYIGYSLLEDDWYRGGYEPSGSLWGPKQGPYIHDKTVAFATAFIEGLPAPFEPVAGVTLKTYDPPVFPVEPNAEPPGVLIQPNPAYVTGDIVEATISGGDPWLLTPIATLEKMTADGAFEPYLRFNQTAVDSNGYEFEIDIGVTPTYKDDLGPIARTFAWLVRFPTLRGAPTTTPALAGGTFRLSVTGLTDWDTPYTVTTAPFTVE